MKYIQQIRPFPKTTKFHLQRCNACNLLVEVPPPLALQTSICPRCQNLLQARLGWNLKKSAILALTILLLMPFAFTFPLLNIELLGVPIQASIWNGIWKMAVIGYPYTAFFVLLCAIVMPVTFVGLILWLQLSYRFQHRPRLVLLALSQIQPWVMLDVYLVALGIAAFKVREYAELSFTLYLIPFLFVTLLTALLFTRINLPRLWQLFYPEIKPLSVADHFYLVKQQKQDINLCTTCGLTFLTSNHNAICPRCHTFNLAEELSLQRVWSCLIAGIIMLFPANFLPISEISLNGVVSADTLMSGVLSFLDYGNYVIAAIVFIASIFIPIAKIVIMLYLLACIHLQLKQPIKLQLKLYKVVHFVGRWSMLDLFVLSLMTALVTRGQIINFSVGPAAVYFGLAVILTMISVSQFDPRLLWKFYDNTTESRK
ncbi:hypothetical protein CEP48_05770 [Mergibacter septicus]|uniref:Uncharacterized protein n=1 Tax=Mergibacter septicus TaxID=221402 RepID=A0A8D4J0H0_9PAST|nr:paraquat-inducible protein A [Mergibacter septicus]AWX15709.1 hypothetical protein CEP47_05770 [Mergibacter septicus]QDJ13184.1 hypothetical protein CEP45_04670 [Mergibacter septicus]QDJ14962.1 hypothetical protein CEP48_05770 [Mergibacter septicus]UTU47614.1 paraquat-inducible protein A [Mergibacter septicus]WMR96780.1 paraquat-inducible protein A [Mergibacter septicus]